jgi:hypothetical protein
MIVDASAVYEVVTHTNLGRLLSRRLAHERDLAAPSVIDVEVYGVRRLEYLQGRLDGSAAGQAIDDLWSWPGDGYHPQELLGHAWDETT